MGQSAPADPRAGDRSLQTDELLRQARGAMAANDLAGAERCIAQAEALGVDRGPGYFGDTPAKTRRDLEQLRAHGAQPNQAFAAQTPGAGALGNPAGGVTRLPPLDTARPVGQGAPLSPFGRSMAAVPPGDNREDQVPSLLRGTPTGPVNLMPAANSSQGMLGGYNVQQYDLHGSQSVTAGPAAPGMYQQNAAPGGASNAAMSNQLLLSARRALAFGDVRRASMFLEQAKAQPVSRGMYDDSPENVEGLVRRYSELTLLPAERRSGESYQREFNRLVLEQADGLLRRGDLDEAERLAQQAARQPVSYGQLDIRPESILQRVAAQRRAQPMAGGSAVIPANAQVVLPAGGGAGLDQRATRALYDAGADPTRTIQASAVQMAGGAETIPPAPSPPSAEQGLPAAADGSSPGMALFQKGEAALRDHQREQALQFYRQAWDYRQQMDPGTVHALSERLQLLAESRPAPTRSGPLDETAARQQVLARQMEADIIHEESAAKAACATDPKRALAMLEDTRQKVAGSSLEPAARDVLLRRLDRSIDDMKRFIADRKPQIEAAAAAQQTRSEVRRERDVKVEKQEKFAQLVDQYNHLMDERRLEEAEVVAKQAYDLDPENPVAKQILLMSKFATRYSRAVDIANRKEDGFVRAMESVDAAAQPVDDRQPYQFGDIREWKRLSGVRLKRLADRMQTRSAAEFEIERKLRSNVSVKFENMPLSRVMETLGTIAGINIFLDPQGLSDEGQSVDTPVTLKLEHDISLKSALNLILQPLRLGYLIKDEVLKVTSEQQREGQVYTVTYNVADLVIPIPNFQANNGMGIDGAYANAMARNQGGMGGGMPFAGAGSGLTVLASRSGVSSHAAINPGLMAQMAAAAHSSPMSAGPPSPAAGVPTATGPGGMGGGSQADFDSLIDLITSTVKPTSWDAVGGPGSIAPFETNLSLVISQTQEVHEQIVDLLEQLRRLQDLQVTIEVRFINLSDTFYERIGIDFQMALPTNIQQPFGLFGQQGPAPTSYAASTVGGPGSGVLSTGGNVGQGAPGGYNVQQYDLHGSQSVTVGLSAPGIYSSTLDIPIGQGSYAASPITALVGPILPSGSSTGDPITNGGIASGFAILSDIDAWFFINAAQGDLRSNVLQAPKVTLFNGQQATVADQSQTPFVISVTPVVGDFAAAQQPVIIILNEGTALTVQAVVSNDRRFVRLTLVPFFSKIGNVQTFTFQGSNTTITDTSTQGIQTTPNDNTKDTNSTTTINTGSNVQLPTFSYVTVSTTVSVPDGGTVLLGGVKRLNEGRNEYGVPILNKIPYLNRLFSNSASGRYTNTLMMMVTPRIIIQEEEEDKLGIQQQP